MGAESLDSLCPFHLVFDENLRVVQVGSSLRRALPQLDVGALLPKHFFLLRPGCSFRLVNYEAAKGSLFVLRSVNTDMVLRGQIVTVSRSPKLLLFFGSPKFTSLDEMRKANLSVLDFSAHDPMLDFIALLDAQGLAIVEARRAASELREAKELMASMNQSLQLLNCEAQSAEIAKSKFIATMSHEIRTPMNGIVAAAELLLEHSLRDEEHHLAEMILRSATNLRHILNDVLDVSKIEAGRLAIEVKPVDLQSLSSEVVELLRSEANKKGVDLFAGCPPGLPLVEADPDRVRQILLNLVGNALKFTKTTTARRGRVSLLVKASDRYTDEIDVEFCVRDNGIGINDDFLDQLFKPFSQRAAVGSGDYGGAGLGLAISRNLARLMGGDITVRSKPDVGSAFTLWLRLRVVNPSNNCERDLEDLALLLRVSDPVLREHMSKNLADRGALIFDEIKEWRLASRRQVSIVDFSGYEENHHGGRSGFDNNSAVFVLPFGARRAVVGGGALVLESLDVNYIARRLLADSLMSSAPSYALPKFNIRVLVVEDDPINCELLRLQFSRLGCDARIVSDAHEALVLLRNGEADVVFTDCYMQRMDGFELTRRIRSEEEADEHVPIVAITAAILPEERERGRQAGMDGWLTKPVRLFDLQAELQHLFPEAVSQESLVFEYKHDEESLDRVIGECDDSARADLYRAFLRNSAEIVRGIEDGAIRRDFFAIASFAHRLKSSVRAVGCLSLGDICEQLEALKGAAGPVRVDWLVASLREQYARLETWVNQRLMKLGG